VLGCVGYRGYFDRAAAEALAEQLRADRAGRSTSTACRPIQHAGLDRLDRRRPAAQHLRALARGRAGALIFHELAHQVVYADDDTTFNESYATAVERLGGAMWLEQHAGDAARAEYAALDGRRREFRALTSRTREELRALYASPLDDTTKRERKSAVMARLRAEHAALKAGRWEGFAGYDGWFARANNATLGLQASYNQLVPAFERLFERSGGDFARFHAEVRALAALPKAERDAKLASDP
jgi:predicted aminopeptidase